LSAALHVSVRFLIIVRDTAAPGKQFTPARVSWPQRAGRVQWWRRVEDRPFVPMMCNENSGDFFSHGLVPVPQTAHPDF
jgi:hypothetical protein